MTQLTDETLVAYVDGELSAEEAAKVEQALQTDQRVREAVQVFRVTADWSRRAYDEVLHEPVPDRLISAASGEGEIATPPAPVQATAPRRRMAGLAMAASIALAVGIGGGFGLFQLTGSGDAGASGPLMVGTVDGSGALHLALESATSGTLIAADNGGNVMPLTTFQGRDGRHCREFQAVTAGPAGLSAAFGIACRQPGGSWHVEAVGAPPAIGSAGPDRYQQAAGTNDDPMQVLIDAMSETGTISLEEEAALLAGGWR